MIATKLAPAALRIARKLVLGTAAIGDSDIAQESLLDVLDCPEHVLNGSDTEKQAWIEMVVRRTARSMFRNQHRAKRDRSRNRSLESSELEECLTHRGRSPADEAERAEQLARVRTAMDWLVPLQRLVVRLRYFEQMSLARIAARLGVAKSSVLAVLKRGKAKLRELLADDGA